MYCINEIINSVTTKKFRAKVIREIKILKKKERESATKGIKIMLIKFPTYYYCYMLRHSYILGQYKDIHILMPFYLKLNYNQINLKLQDK